MKAIAFAPMFNSPGKKDAIGAFQPEAARFTSTVVRFDNEKPLAQRRAVILDALRTRRGLDAVAFFCHGLPASIQAGFGIAHTRELAEAIFKASSPRVVVALYCCSTADGGPGGDGGFADRLRDRLCEAGSVFCRVDGHDRAGHTTTNPFVRRFEGEGSRVGGVGGRWIVTPYSAPWNAWRKALHGPLRLKFPTMTIVEIHSELGGSSANPSPR